jgi:ABC-type hemin transport system substrate-binding protein
VNAVRNKRIYVIDSDLLFRAGPRLAEGLKTLAAKIGY